MDYNYIIPPSQGQALFHPGRTEKQPEFSGKFVDCYPLPGEGKGSPAGRSPSPTGKVARRRRDG